MRPAKNVLVCGNDPVHVSAVSLMLRVQGFSAWSCNRNGAAKSLSNRFYYCAVLLEMPHENLSKLAETISEKRLVPVIRATPGCGNTTILENVRILSKRRRGPAPAEPEPARQLSA